MPICAIALKGQCYLRINKHSRLRGKRRKMEELLDICCKAKQLERFCHIALKGCFSPPSSLPLFKFLIEM